MKNKLIKCTRCRHKMRESDLIDKPTKNPIIHNRVCPLCRCKSYYDLSPLFAWCWASGLIELGETPPADKSDGSGAIVFGYGPQFTLKPLIEVLARHGKGESEGKWMVPGVPEAPDQDTAFDALDSWVRVCSVHSRRYRGDSKCFFGNDARSMVKVPH